MPVAPTVLSARCLRPSSIFRSIANAIISVSFSHARSARVPGRSSSGCVPSAAFDLGSRAARGRRPSSSPRRGGRSTSACPGSSRLRHEERALPQRYAIADVQLLQLGHDPIGAVNIESEDVLQSVVAVQAAAPLPHLDEPRPDGGGRSRDCDGARGGERRAWQRARLRAAAGAPPPRLPPTDAVAAQARRMR